MIVVQNHANECFNFSFCALFGPKVSCCIQKCCLENLGLFRFRFYTDNDPGKI